MNSDNLEIMAFVNELERERMVANCDRMRELGLLDNELLRGKSPRAWAAERLLALALRLDRRLALRETERAIGSWGQPAGERSPHPTPSPNC